MAVQNAPGDFGRRLREARERRGLSLRQIASATKISMITLEALERNDIARLPVLEGGQVRGIIAEHEIAAAFADLKSADSHVQRVNIRDLQVEPYMRRQVVTGHPEMSARDAAQRMLKEHVGALPVVAENGTIQGIVTRTDLIRTFAPAIPAVA